MKSSYGGIIAVAVIAMALTSGTVSAAPSGRCGEHGDRERSAGPLICRCHNGYSGDLCQECFAGFHRNEDGACVFSGFPMQAPGYTLDRYWEQREKASETGHRRIVPLLYIASGDPARIAEAERMIHEELDLGIENTLGYFHQDIVTIYHQYRDRLSPALQFRIAAAIKKHTRQGTPFLQEWFHHVSDGSAMQSAMFLILGGEAIGRPDLVERGIIILEKYLHMYGELGLSSTYNTPVYSALELTAVETLARLPSNLRARVAARVAVERLWQQVALRFHDPSSSFGAPISRAYNTDLHGAISNMRHVLHPLLPNGVLLDDVTFPKLAVDKRGGRSMLAERSALQFLLAPHLIDIFTRKPFPYSVRAFKYRPYAEDRSTRSTPSESGYFDTYTYMTKRYVVGSAERQYVADAHPHSGAGSPFQIHWTRRPGAAQPGDVRTLFVRYRINDEKPSLKRQWIVEDGFPRAVQSENTVLLAYSPHALKRDQIRALALTAIIPRHGDIEYVEMSDGSSKQVFSGQPLVAQRPAEVFIRDGDVYIALLPLTITDRGRRVATKIEQTRNHLLISWYNLQDGDVSSWMPTDFLETQNGLVIEVGDREEYGSFPEFRAAISPSVRTDAIATGVRRLRYSRADGSRAIEADFDLGAHRFVRRTVEGQPYRSVALESPHTIGGNGPVLSIGDAILATGEDREMKLLTHAPGVGSYVVTLPFRYPIPISLTAANGGLASEGFGMGRIVYSPRGEEEVTTLLVDVASAPSPLRMKKPAGAYAVVVNDKDVTQQVVEAGDEIIVFLPGNDIPRADASLEVSVAPGFDKLAKTGRGAVSARIRNRSGSPARGVMASPYFCGFVTDWNTDFSPRIEEIPAGGSAEVRWAVHGIPRGGTPGVRVLVTAENAASVRTELGCQLLGP